LTRLLIADANLLIRSGVRAILVEAGVVDEVSEAASSTEAVEQLRASRWDLCLLDVGLPQRGGLEVLQHIRKGRYGTRVALLSTWSERQYAPMALRLGAHGYLLKDCSREELIAAARMVAADNYYVSPQLSDQLIRHAVVDAPPYTRLSQREFQIFQRLARGTAITVISKELSISPKSVSTYRARILEKTRCRNNAEITQYAMREGLL
jgi:DNA-binding NarL/FixJ family response regulator